MSFSDWSNKKKKKTFSEWSNEKNGITEEDIAPTVSTKPTTSTEKEEDKPWYKSGVFEDGYQIGDVSKHILGLFSDTADDIAPYVVGLDNGQKQVQEVQKQENAATDNSATTQKEDSSRVMNFKIGVDAATRKSIYDANAKRIAEIDSQLAQNESGKTSFWQSSNPIAWVSDKFSDSTKALEEERHKLVEANAKYDRYGNAADLSYDELKAKQAAAKDEADKLHYLTLANQKLISDNTELMAKTQMDDTDHSVYEELQQIASMEDGEEKEKRKAAAIKKMESLGIKSDDYALYSDDDNFSWGTFFDWFGKSFGAGWESANAAFTSTLDATAGALLKGVGWENNPISSIAKYYEDSYNNLKYDADLYKERLGGGNKYEYGSKLVEGTGAALPAAIMAFATKGQSLTGIVSTSALSTNMAYASGGILQKAGLTLSSMMKNPQYWFSFAQTYGSDYKEAKSKGADDFVASLSATITSLVNAGVEIGADGGSGIQGLPKKVAEGGSNAILEWVKSSVEEGGEEVVQGVVTNAVARLTHDDDAEIANPEEMLKEFLLGAGVGGLLGGTQIAVQSGTNAVTNAIQQHEVRKLTETEQKVFDKIYEERIAEESEKGDVSKKRKSEIYDEVLNEMEKGYFSTDTIDEMFGGDAYKAYKDNIAKEEALRNEYEKLYNTKIGNKSDAEVDRQAELKKMLEDIDKGTTRAELQSKLRDTVFGTIKGSRLVNSYIDSENTKKRYVDDATKQTNKYAKATIENAIKSGVLNNSNRAHEMTETLSKISSDQNVVYDYVNDKIIAEQGRQKQRKVTKTFTADGKTAEFSLNTKRMDSNVKPVVKVGNTVVENYTVDYETGNIVFDSAPKKGKITVDYGAFDRINGWIETLEDGTKKITLNMDSNEVWQFTTGHEITHKLEGTKKYSKFREVLYQYAKDKGDYDGLMESVKKRYEEGTDYDSELTADLVGRYLFQDEDFVKHLSVNHRNVFQWLWDEVKHLSKLVTAGSKEARQLEKVKHAFEEAYRAGGKANAKTGTQYNLSEAKVPTRAELESKKPIKVVDISVPQTQGSFAERRKQILNNVDEVISKPYLNSDTGAMIFLTKKSYTHAFNNLGDIQLNAAEHLPELIENAVLTHAEKATHGSDYTDGVYTFFAAAKSGHVHPVKLKVKEYTYAGQDLPQNIKEYFESSPQGYASSYDTVVLEVEEIEKSPTGSVKDMNQDDSFLDPDGPYTISIADLLKLVKGDSEKYIPQYSISDSDGNQLTEEQQEYFKDSKVRDDNGNLRVVYHGTPNTFTTFRPGTAEGWGTGIYFTDNKAEAENYGENIVEAYLNITNPFNADTMSYYDIGAENTKAYKEYDMKRWRDSYDGYDSYEEYKADGLGADMHDIYADDVEVFNKILRELGYDGIIADGSNGIDGLEIVAFNANQAKLTTNQAPTPDADIRYSLARNDELMSNAENYNKANLGVALDTAKQQRQEIYEFMTQNANRLKLPEDIEGNTAIKNSSYDITEENTTVCIRSMAADALCDAVAEHLGRPLTVQDTLRISQDLMNYTDEPECVYCYVATDRRAYREFLGSYYNQMQSAIEAIKSGKNIEEVYQAFLDGRKDTKNMRKRFEMWQGIANGNKMISAKDLASEKMMQIAMKDPELAAQVKDARAYAQSASWAKKRMGYQSYDGHILKWPQRRINDLNKHYGLRFYSFSDFSPAFVLENMQQITDAAVRGLKGLAYTKVLDFAEIFAPTGININISVFGYDNNGTVAQDGMMGADWNGAQALRNKYENVGITFVATNDTQIEWALDQDWIDVVIPYHLVRTGQAVAKHFGYTNYTAESGDTKGANWKKGDKKTIYPSEHNNDKHTYLAAITEANLEPRFARWVNHPNYMKLVNETRRSANDTPPMQANFNVDAAKDSLERMAKRGGYFVPIGGDYENMQDIASGIADEIRASEQNSISFGDEAPVRYGNFATPMSEVRYEAPTEEVAPVQEVAEEAATPAPVAPVQAELPDEYNSAGTSVGVEETAPMHEAKTEPKGTIKGQQMMWGGAGGMNAHVANVMVDEPQVEKKKSRAWSKFRTNFLDKFSVFEDLSLKHKNRELIGKANYMLSAESRAQRLIGNGYEFARVKSLNSIIEEVGNTGKTKQFFEYLYHMHNIDRMTLEERFKNVENKPVFGYSVTAKVSQETIEQLEKANPEFKQFAQDVYGFNKHLRNMLVENGVISSETAELWETMYPHFVPIRRLGDTGLNVNVPLDTGKTGVNAPIKRAKGGSRDIMNLFDTMAQRTIQTYKAVAKNNFGVELKNTLRSTITNENASIDEIIDSIDMQDGLLQEGKNGNSPTFTVFENGERVTFEITEDMYDALKPMSEGLAYTNKFANKVSNLHRGLLTEYNPTFLLTNAIKDAQDVLINSQHAAKTYANFPKALQEIVRKGDWYNEYLNNGGEQNTYFDKETNTFKSEERRGLGKVIGIPLDTIGKLNNAVEMLPRLAEYIASREDGRSVEVSMLDAARVTTNFAAGGDITKLLNRNGFTFLNASVQGFNQQVRNIREAKANGLKGWVQLAAKAAGAGLSAMLLNHLLWDDDDDYEELSDYVKQNYYVVAKFGDGKFVRIPKGRTLAVIQSAFEQVSNALTGDDEVDLHSFLELAISNLAPNNPLENNIIAPIMQVASNKTWYGEDLVPTRLQDVPSAEQYDESTDSLSRWLGEVLDYSPYKINYLLNQYSGGIGDVFLPMMTPEAESGDDSLLGSFTAPLRDKFTTDSVMNNQNVSDFYDMKDKLTMNANSSKATDEDILKSKYFNAINSEMGKLYAEKREIQNSNLSDAVKYEQVRDIQKQIDSLARNSLNSYEDVTINGNYATVGDVHYRKDDNGTWQKINDDQLEKQEDVINHLGISETEYWSNKEEYDYAYKYPENYAIAKSVGGYTAYRTYASELYDIKADKDEYGKSISGSRKDKVIDYVNNLDIDYGARLILFKSEYPSDDTYNYDIINYLEENDAISGEEMRTILTELGFHVSDDGTISWD